MYGSSLITIFKNITETSYSYFIPSTIFLTTSIVIIIIVVWFKLSSFRGCFLGKNQQHLPIRNTYFYFFMFLCVLIFIFLSSLNSMSLKSLLITSQDQLLVLYSLFHCVSFSSLFNPSSIKNLGYLQYFSIIHICAVNNHVYV